MSCTSFIEAFSLKMLRLVTHFSCSQSNLKYISPRHGRPELPWKPVIKDQSAYKPDDDAYTAITKQPSSAALDPTMSLHPEPLGSSSPTKSGPAKNENLVFEKETEKREEAVDESLAEPSARRLSVQDQISLFETKFCSQSLDITYLHSPSEVPRRCSDANTDMIDIYCDSEEVKLTNEVRSNSGTTEVVLKDSAYFKNRLYEFNLKRKEIKEQSKGNQEVNDNLRIKADELENLFREYKLRIHEHQATRLTKDGEDHKNGLSNNTRGKLYDSYIKKRDVRLMELWDSNRAEKEAILKSMNGRLAQLSLLVDKQNSVSITNRRAERLRLFTKNEQFKDDDDTSTFSHIETFDNGVSRNARGKKPLLIKNLSTSTRQTTTAAPIPKSSTKLVPTASKLVPNFSDSRKENMKLCSAVRKWCHNPSSSRRRSARIHVG